MTINAPAAWLLVAVCRRCRRAPARAAARNSPARPRTTSSRNICRAAPMCSRPARPCSLIKDTIAVHGIEGNAEMESDECLLLPPAGGRRDARAGAELTHSPRRSRCSTCVKASGRSAGRPDWARSSAASPSSSMPACASSPKSARCAPSSTLWDEICRDRVMGSPIRSSDCFRYGVQVNSLGLTEQQPENNVYRILLEMLAVTLSKKARARAVQLPAWNEALGLPRPFDQQWSLRMRSRSSPMNRTCWNTATSSTARPRFRNQGRCADPRGQGRAGHHRPAGRRRCRGRDGLHEAAAGREQHPAAGGNRKR
jgi:hypothetical protein